MKKLVVSLSTAMALVATAQAQNVPVRVTADAPVTAPYPVSIVVTKAALKKLPKISFEHWQQADLKEQQMPDHPSISFMQRVIPEHFPLLHDVSLVQKLLL